MMESTSSSTAVPTAAKQDEEQRANPKRRWTRQEKALRKQEQTSNTTGKAATKTRKKPRPMPLSPSERLLKCAEDAAVTGSVHAHRLYEQQRHRRRRRTDERDTIHVTTYCRRPHDPSSISHNTIEILVQPLLVLDLNGILCHRIRKHKLDKHQSYNFRPSAAHIANTPIVPRVDLVSFLSFLDAHFCLAVWTSAKLKNAKKLVNLLFPIPIRERVLFIWGQSKCNAIPREYNEKPLFQKPIPRIWEDYPLWNASNTLLLDDSPQKCPMEHSVNTLHPPPLHGQQQQQHQHETMSDLENEQLQMKFFHGLVQEMDNGGNLESYLEKCGRGHMGWRGPNHATTKETSES